MRGSRAAAAVVAAVTLVLTSLGGGASEHVASSYLVVWAGDWSAADLASRDARASAEAQALDEGLVRSAAPGPDFLAVVDADPASPDYGKVVRTVTVPGLANEPHHMQYSWRRGDRIYAGALFGDRTFVFDASDLPNVRLAGTVEPLDTPCGSVPDAYWVLEDGTAFGTYMGGPNVAGDPRCNGGNNNGFAGTPGTIVRIAPDGRVLGEFSAAGDPASPFAADLRSRCASNPPLPGAPSCANPHGIQAREDLGVMITSDYAEPRNVPTDPAAQPNNDVFRDTVRVWDISNADAPRLQSVSVMPLGSMEAVEPQMEDPRGFMGIMETTVTNLPGHKGAFASSMCGGQIYYTADITASEPLWRQVFDPTVAGVQVDESYDRLGGCIGAGWLQTSPDDTMLFQAVIGRNPRTLNAEEPGVPKMVYAIDIRNLVAVPPSEWVETNPAVCNVDTRAEVFNGGSEASCPSLAGVIELPDTTSGGPHWGAIDNFSLAPAAGRLSTVTRIAASNYFVARAGSDGNHRICMIEVSATGALTLDETFRDENTGAPCVSFDRMSWPHGETGYAKPHSILFVAP